MKKNINKVVGCSVVIISLLVGGKVVFSEPGSNKDPLISKSYVDGKIDEVKKYIDSKVKNNSSTSGSSSSTALEIVELRAGQSMIGASGTEMILRSGTGLAIGSQLGGISDITGGKDLNTGEKIAKNHMVIIPRDDGRGVYSRGETFWMVRGSYTIE